ncbi:MAG: ABC transporter permease [Rickettsiales bacterium]
MFLKLTINIGRNCIICFNYIKKLLIQNTYSILKFIGFAFYSFVNNFFPPIYFKIFLTQLMYIGLFSVPVIALTGIFSGAVLALQSYYSMSKLIAESSVPMILVLSLTRELGPVLSGLILAGRAGAFITAELSTMRVTDQIDAIYTLSINPIKYLIAPRILATLISLPILVIIFNILGFFGGYMVAIYKLNFAESLYIQNTLKYLNFIDIISGLTKALFFGFIIGANSCYKGYYAKGGAKGVGLATTNAVVTSSVIILIFNYIITEFFI